MRIIICIKQSLRTVRVVLCYIRNVLVQLEHGPSYLVSFVNNFLFTIAPDIF